MAKLNIFDMDQLKNVNERRVWEILSDYLDNYPDDICKCGVCVVDMAAIVLNHIKPCYQVDEKIETAVTLVPDSAIMQQIEKAVKLVSIRPHH